MPEETIREILQRLESGNSQEAWAEFLREYSPQIFQVVRHFDPDPDRAADCFQFVCKSLVAKNFHRLRKFKPGGSAKFSTWLRAVVRNLCLDWHRRQFGRRRLFRSISRLPFFDQEVFRLIHERRASAEETLLELASKFPNATPELLAQSRERIEEGLTIKQRLVLDARHAQTTFGSGTPLQDGNDLANITDTRPDPEAQAILNERRVKLARALGRMPVRDRLLVRLRFEQELTLEQCARLTDLGNAQRTDRQIKDILARLRRELS
ncbi:MAG: RNA polymerase sigma factor [Pyrinomonadaceae bacterium]